jgi:hypothetical protein
MGEPAESPTRVGEEAAALTAQKMKGTNILVERLYTG